MSGKRRSRATRHVFVAMAWLCAACHDLTDPVPPATQRLLVHAVLDLGTQRQLIWLQETSANGTNSATPVLGASVILTGPDGVDMVAQPEVMQQSGAPRGMYVVDLDAAGATLAPGGTYALRIVTADGAAATGTTTLPQTIAGAFDTAMVRPFDWRRDTLRLDWARVPGAKSYHVTISGRRSLQFPGADTQYYHRYSVFADTSIALPGTLDILDEGQVFYPGEEFIVAVSAVDDNFYTYYHVFVDPFAGAPPSRLTGAIGVFGSLVPLIVRRYAVSAEQAF